MNICYNTSEKTCLQGISSAILQRRRRFSPEKRKVTVVTDKTKFCYVLMLLYIIVSVQRKKGLYGAFFGHVPRSIYKIEFHARVLCRQKVVLRVADVNGVLGANVKPIQA